MEIASPRLFAARRFRYVPNRQIRGTADVLLRGPGSSTRRPGISQQVYRVQTTGCGTKPSSPKNPAPALFTGAFIYSRTYIQLYRVAFLRYISVLFLMNDRPRLVYEYCTRTCCVDAWDEN
jgi:hypothetical protein